METRKVGKRYSTERHERLRGCNHFPSEHDEHADQSVESSSQKIVTPHNEDTNESVDDQNHVEVEEAEQKALNEYIRETEQKCTARRIIREKNGGIVGFRPDETVFTKLDSSLKKNNAFVRKLKTFTESQKESVMKDITSLNLTKYISEVANAIVEAKLKMADIDAAVEVCCLLHEWYADFADALLENWLKVLLQKKDEKVTNPTKFRVDLRFFAELISVGVLPEKGALNILSNQLNILVNYDKEEHQNVSVIQSFCKYCGQDYAGLVPRKFRLLLDKYNLSLPSCPTLPPEKQKGCRNLLKDYYASIVEQLKRDHKELRQTEWQNKRILHTKGELSHERQEKYEQMRVSYQKLLANVLTLSDLVDEEMCVLEDIVPMIEGGDMKFNAPHEFMYDGDTALFEDEETQHFYENLLDLRPMMPQILLKDQPAATGIDTVQQSTDEVELKVEDIEKELQDEKESEEELDALPSADELEAEAEVGEDSQEVAATAKLLFEKYLQDLQNCVNRELIDSAAQDFCMSYNTKSNRKKLARALFGVQRTRYDLLPFYSRLVATLFPFMPDVAAELCSNLKLDFKWLVRKKDQINIESKLKAVRFIGELVKFSLFSKVEALHCLKLLLFDFSHHNIDMACALMETCGRYLYRSPDSHHRTRVYLEVMMRKKALLSHDSRYTTMIENAFYYSNPPSSANIVKETRPPLHEFIRKLLYKDLNKLSTDKVLHKMRKLNWSDPDLKQYIVKSMTAVGNVKYSNIHCMASLLAGLTPYHEDVAVSVVDGVLEEIRLGMEVNHPAFNQQRIATVKYLGELYNYRLVDSTVIFKTLYSFITFGLNYNDETLSSLDPPSNLFRLSLTCILLETCGQYFDRGSSKKKLDYFLIYFQKYFWFKKKSPYWDVEMPFPVTVDMVVNDALEAVRPKDKFATSYEDACDKANQLTEEFKSKLSGLIPSVEQETASEDVEDGREADNLTTITEDDEDESQSPHSLPAEEMENSGTQHDRSVSREKSNSQEETSASLSQSQSQLDAATPPPDQEIEFEMKQKAPKLMVCAEDDDFLVAFDKMLVENIQARSQEAIKVPHTDITVPLNLKTQLRKPFVTAKGSMLEADPESDTEQPKTFALMTKKGNKPQLAAVDLAITQQFATRYKERELEEKAEKERLKQLVLEINERQEEEELAALEAGKVPAPNTNREKKLKYLHPKGAPDADLIFGSGPKVLTKR